MRPDSPGRAASFANGRHPLPGVGYLLDEDRARKLAGRLPGELTAPGIGVTRAVLFITPRCNMACRYCSSTGHRMPHWPEDQVLQFIDRLAASGTRHLQWTGGEATLRPDLPRLVEHAATHGLSQSLSTNGTAPPSRLLELIDAGLRRFQVSLDTTDATVFDEITRSRQRLPAVLASLRTLHEQRRRGTPIHITVNIVLHPRLTRDPGDDETGALARLLAWMPLSGADDFKLLPPSSRRLGELFESPAARARFLETCRRQVLPRFKMFHLRLQTIARGGHGLGPAAPRTCYQCLDDRAFDSIRAYPCVIHLREGGAPLYLNSDPLERQRERIAAFLARDRRDDPVCARHCFDLYRRLNERVDRLINQQEETDQRGPDPD